jgi:hypothetical protein
MTNTNGNTSGQVDPKLIILAENKQGMTTEGITEELHRRGISPKHTVSQLTELYKAGKVNFTAKRKSPLSGRKTALWTVRKD